ncbi:hypothetical protein [uncultured Massilia sp.]|uniref:hypothetical protein n=1 Tax=uncultured Massilia sp. TaxID=169973 RepID=UPI00258DE7BC|nr:hypothetical protein [uncultured Massilia sp.]
MQQHPVRHLDRDTKLDKRVGASSDATHRRNVDGYVDEQFGQAVGTFVHPGSMAGGRRPGLALAQQCYTPPMFGKVKQLRRGGKRLPNHEIQSSNYVEGEVRVYGLAGVIVACVTKADSQVADPLIPLLYDAKLISMHGSGMLFKGEERPQGDAGPAFIQEWSVMVENS